MKFIIIISYCPELQIYQRARHIWQIYVSFFQNVEVLFYKVNSKLGPGEIYFDGFDFNVGVDEAPPLGSD